VVPYDNVPQGKNCRVHRILWFVPQSYLGLYHIITAATTKTKQKLEYLLFIMLLLGA
jgi:hypothetical protein